MRYHNGTGCNKELFMKKPSPRYIFPSAISGADIKEVRARLGMSQREFAAFAGASKPTVERWEAGASQVTGPIVSLVTMLMRDPGIVSKMVLPENTLRIRLYYMYESFVCTVIDVDDTTRRVEIRNYTDNLMLRAFGANTEPSYDEYQEFLESRCFPRTRDKIKLELARLDIPFYDPFLIIEKTEGRMADDKFHIRIERN